MEAITTPNTPSIRSMGYLPNRRRHACPCLDLLNDRDVGLLILVTLDMELAKKKDHQYLVGKYLTG